MNKIKNIVSLIDEADRIFNSTADWEIKYDLIFDMGIWKEIRASGFSFDWYDPDTTYQEDITAYHSALMEFKQKLGDLA